MNHVPFAWLLLLFVSIICVSSENLYIVTSHDSSCPSEITGKPCLTFKQFVAYPSQSLNITLNLESGNHSLTDGGEYVDSSIRRDNLIMTAESAIIFFTSHRPRAHFSIIFSSVRYYVEFRGITFQNVHITVQYTQELKVYDCNFQGGQFVVSQVSDANFSRCTFSGYGNYQHVNDGYILLTYYYNGGALLLFHSTVRINQCIFRNNEGAILYGDPYDSGIYSLIISESIFANNTSQYYRVSAVEIYGLNRYYSYSYNIIVIELIINITDTIFVNNTLNHGEGGALRVNGNFVELLVYQSSFINNINTATESSSGAIQLNGRYSRYTLSENTFVDNSANLCGAISISNSYHNITIITNNTFYFNKAESVMDIGGGAMCVLNAEVLVSNCTFVGNTAKVDGGAIVSENSTITIIDSIFHKNTAWRDGGALSTNTNPSNYTIINSRFVYNQAGDDGGALHLGRKGSHVRLEECSFVNNSAIDRGRAISIFGSTLEITNTDIYGPTGETVSACNSSVSSSIPFEEQFDCFSNYSPFSNKTTKMYCYQNFTLNFSINEHCIQYLHTDREQYSHELSKIIAISYASLSFSIVIVISTIVYITVTRLLRCQANCNGEVTSPNGDHSEPVYKQAHERDNNEDIEMKPNVLYVRHQFQ